jgi:DnaA family protein
MKQLLLDLSEEQAQTLASFEPGRNGELLHVLAQCADRSGIERFVYLWGEQASGKTHLLQALAAGPAARYIPGALASSTDFDFDPAVTLYLLDDCHLLSPQAQIDAFNLFNHIREAGSFLVSAGSGAPMQLQVREDLRTRLGWGLIYQVHGLSDDEKIAALTATAQARGLPLSPGVLPYLLSHFRRDMRSLSTMLVALDRYSLETKRPITLPLLRSLLQETPTDP